MFCVYWVGSITSWANEILFKVQIIKKYHPATYQDKGQIAVQWRPRIIGTGAA